MYPSAPQDSTSFNLTKASVKVFTFREGIVLQNFNTPVVAVSSSKSLGPPHFQFLLADKRTGLRVEVELLRKAETRNTATKKRAGQKARDLLKLYPEAKAKDLMARLRSQGLWAWDEDFDKDEEDWG